MRYVLVLLILSGLSVPAAAQRYQIDTGTPEGLLLGQAGQEESEAKRMALYEEFLQKYPNHAGKAYASEQLAPLYLKAGQHDKAIAATEIALAAQPANSSIAYNALQACEAKKDPDCVIAWSNKTVDAAKKLLAGKKPDDEEEEDWAKEQDYAKQVTARCEYSLYAAMLWTQDNAKVVALGDALEKMNPESQYFPQAAGRYALALQQSGNKDKAGAVAEKALAKEKTNEDLMLIASDMYLSGTNKNADKSVEYAQMLVNTMSSKPMPQGVDPAAWDKRKNAMLGLGHWMAGSALATQNKWAETDKAFRDALPFIKDNVDLLAPAYFYLGLANYNMSKVPKANPKLRAEAKRFSELCAAIKSPYQGQAIKNLNVINSGK